MSEQPSLVYLYGFSTILESKLNTVKEIIEHQLNQDAQVSFVFIHDAVIGTSHKHKISPIMKDLLELPIQFYSMIPDLKARGIDPLNLRNRIIGIGYEELVDILVSIPKIISWM